MVSESAPAADQFIVDAAFDAPLEMIRPVEPDMFVTM
jgi:hypothetical protein